MKNTDELALGGKMGSVADKALSDKGGNEDRNSTFDQYILPGKHGGKTLSDSLARGADVVIGDAIRGGVGKLDGFDKPDIFGDFRKNVEVTDKDRKEAQSQLDKQASKLIPEADRKAMSEISGALLSGDQEAFSKAIGKYANDPAKLAALVGEVNKNLKNKGSDTQMAVNKDGKVVVHNSDSSEAVEFDPKTGKSAVLSVEHGFHGPVQGGEILGADAGAVFKRHGDDAVNGVLGRDSFVKPIPFYGFDKPWLEKLPYKKTLEGIGGGAAGGAAGSALKGLERMFDYSED
ncbi:MAG: hypothetical protein K2Y32_11865 [Candidatus Obscuribacterales bacterium]|nr:hypothetical protein [Candidatus Obscuribacterales bacterium]